MAHSCSQNENANTARRAAFEAGDRVLRDIRPLTGSSRYVFPSLLTRQRPMSENTINTVLRRLGYSGDEMTARGFRAMASTALNEQGWNPDLIELQLAHAERNKVRQPTTERRDSLNAGT
jgi:integrase